MMMMMMMMMMMNMMMIVCTESSEPMWWFQSPFCNLPQDGFESSPKKCEPQGFKNRWFLPRTKASNWRNADSWGGYVVYYWFICTFVAKLQDNSPQPKGELKSTFIRIPESPKCPLTKVISPSMTPYGIVVDEFIPLETMGV